MAYHYVQLTYKAKWLTMKKYKLSHFVKTSCFHPHIFALHAFVFCHFESEHNTNYYLNKLIQFKNILIHLNISMKPKNILMHLNILIQPRRRRRLKGIHSRSDTNRNEAEGLSFYYPRLLHCLNQMLAVMSLS